jgi:hypothetical protein
MDERGSRRAVQTLVAPREVAWPPSAALQRALAATSPAGPAPASASAPAAAAAAPAAPVEPITLEYSVHTVGAALRKECELVFSRLREAALAREQLLAVATFQRSAVDLVQWGERAQAAKDAGLDAFFRFAGAVCQRLRPAHWADAVDPCSGYPAIDARANCAYNEVQGMQSLLGYRTVQVGAGAMVCHVLLHPRWGTFCYPATLFTTAPLPALRAALEAAVCDLQAGRDPPNAIPAVAAAAEAALRSAALARASEEALVAGRAEAAPAREPDAAAASADTSARAESKQ